MKYAAIIRVAQKRDVRVKKDPVPHVISQEKLIALYLILMKVSTNRIKMNGLEREREKEQRNIAQDNENHYL